ncbi:ROK family protein [Thermosulfurimonas marina]|uniref:ROK family protein n=1 Tax=Thermosulfurimonas marina TaxID=2047767 RepID=A0A6H1WTG1_9BACT|nr:ROK family protein [Thermosulfurimonas marina]QJA06461.1 ROK family protein [Thermosulfurimonas marina]
MILAADIGGTRSRLGLGTLEGPFRLSRVEILENAAFRSPKTLLKRYLSTLSEVPEMGVLAVAGPVQGRRARLTNLGWKVDAGELERALGFPFFLLNDLEAAAYGLFKVPASEVEKIKPGRRRGAVVAVLGVGTGLGEALLVRHFPLALASEGGHAEYPVDTEEEWGLYRFLKGRFGHVSLERVISGPGLSNVYAYFSGRESSPEEILAAARKGEREALSAVRLVVRALGREASSLVLKALALSGVYLLGGLAQALRPWLDREFEEAFLAKGRLRELLEKVPVYLVRHPSPALLGAALYGRILRARLSAHFLPHT